jgi:[protein-PII] uridylyltransferase
VSATPTPSESLGEVRAGVLRRPGLVGVRLRAALADAYDDWLRTMLADLPLPYGGVALAAVGSLGRREVVPGSDLDLLLLHDGRVGGLPDLAERIWYPIWDSGVGLDHSVRTADEAVKVARTDLKALLGMLALRHVAGEEALTAAVRTRVLDAWRASAPTRVGELREQADGRAALAGEAAFLLEPDLKDSRGGLRDGQALQALALAQLVDVSNAAREAHTTLLDVRGELHRRAGRADDVLRLQEQDGVGEALGLGAASGEEVLRRVNRSARVLAHSLDAALVRSQPLPRRRFGRAPRAPSRVGLARDVVAQDGEVVLARDAKPATDPGLVLRAARAAAEAALPLSEFTLGRLATETPAPPEPWPDQLRADFLALLGTGPAAVPVLESLDLAGLLEPLVPEWSAVRFRAQHNPLHRFTVDRHLLETAARAAALTRSVSRPDLLLVGALLHDIGKGRPGDHSAAGAELATTIALRMGFAAADVAVIAALARHHLLLPDTATRRDLDDPATLGIVTAAVAGSAGLLDLLHALAIADAAATGPAAWSDWKAGLVADLVRRAHAVLRGAPPEPVAELDDERRALAEAGELAVLVRPSEVVVAAADGVGVLYRTAGVLALHLLDVRSASIRTHAGMAVNTFAVEPRFGTMPEASRVRAELARVLSGDTGLAERLRVKERSYARPAAAARPAPTVHWFDDEATDATVLEYRADDSLGLLCRVTAALERCQLDVRSARVSSLAGAVVDAFYVTTRDGAPVPRERRPDIEAELLRA